MTVAFIIEDHGEEPMDLETLERALYESGVAPRYWPQQEVVATKLIDGVDVKMAAQLRRSIELNARMVTRLQRYARQIQENGCDSQLAAKDIIDISQDKDPWA